MSGWWRSRDEVAAVLVGCSLAALLAAEERQKLLASVVVAAVACLVRALGVRLPPVVWQGLSVAVLGLFAAQLLVLRVSPLLAATQLLLYLIVNKVHHLDGARDYRQLLLVTFLAMLALAVLAVVWLVVPFYLAYGVLALRLLDLLHWQRVAGPVASAAAPAHPGMRPRQVLAAAGLAWLLALVLFFLFPRVGAGTLQASLVRPQHVSGFSAEVDLDDIGQIKTNDTLVARIHIRAGDGARLKLLRVAAYMRFDGRRWQRPRGPWRHLKRRDGDRAFELAPGGGATALLELDVEPLTQMVLPVPPAPVTINGRMQQLYVDRTSTLSLPPWGRFGRQRMSYQVAADLSTDVALGLAAGELEPARYTELPPLDPRVTALSAEVIGGAADPATAAARVIARLDTDYGYALDLDAADDPLSEFLFTRRAGHCELFATAMTVLLRAGGIPARVVNGFRVSEWNELGSYFIVRQADAHAWVEVLEPERGWVTYDPTPPDPERSRWMLGLRGLSHLSDFLLFQWDRYVISFSGVDQQLALTTLGETLAAGGRWLATSPAAVAAAALLAVAVWLGWRSRRRRPAAASEAAALYGALRARLAAAGAPLGPTIGPGAVADRFAALPSVRAVLAVYVASRFAGRTPSAAAMAEARRAIGRVRRELAAARRAPGGR